MFTESLVQLALDVLGCKQKDLALRLNVSPAQISKWKKGEHMSLDQENKLREITGIGDMDPDFILSAGSIEDARKWERLLRYLAGMAIDSSETGYECGLLEDESSLLCSFTLRILHDLGIEIPKPFPSEFSFDYDDLSDSEERDQLLDRLMNSPPFTLIYSLYKSYTDVYGFYAAYVSEILDEMDLYESPAMNIEPCLLELAASKLKDVPESAVNFRSFCKKTRADYKEWLSLVKDHALRTGMPLKAELLDMVHQSHDALGHYAEAESLDFNSSRLHPDIYMNELLVGMRLIHQVLPAILKKLEIYDKFQVDGSKLRID